MPQHFRHILRLSARRAATASIAGFAIICGTAGAVNLPMTALAGYLAVYSLMCATVVLLMLRPRAAAAERITLQARLNSALDDSSVGVYELDYVNNLAYVSPSLCRMLGRPVEPGPIALDRWLGSLQPGHVDDSRRALEERIARGELRYERELRIEVDDGSARRLLSSVRLTLGADGRLAVARGATVDITATVVERDQARAAAADKERYFTVALEAASVPFNILAPVRDVDGHVVDLRWSYMNPAAARMYGREEAELLGRRVTEVLPRNWDTPDLLERLTGVIEGTACEFETNSAHRPDVWMQVIAAPLLGSAAVWFTDISERKRQERSREDADRRKDEFLATLAHELRNPLAPIRQCISVARSAGATQAQKERSHDIIERQVKNMSMLLDDLLDVSRVSRGTLLLRKSSVDWSAVAEAAIEVAQPHLDAKKHQFKVEYPAAPVTLELDLLRMAQVIGNLLTNAAKYTDPHGHIAMRADLEDGDFVIRVSDDGIGIGEERLARLFEMFVQAPEAAERAQGGLGIGLALARSLVRLHGGDLVAASAGPGRGSEFMVRLPGALMAAQPAPADGFAQHRGSPGAKKRILIADDNVDAADSLAELLRLEGHEVHVAYDGQQALDQVALHRPEFALLDVGMPKLSGLEVARRIRATLGSEGITLIAITGWGQAQDRSNAIEAGFDHHATKPVDPDHVVRLLSA